MSNALTILREMKSVLNRFKKDEGGVTLIEYTVLLGILLVAVIAIIVTVGHWISGQWTALNAAI